MSSYDSYQTKFLGNVHEITLPTTESVEIIQADLTHFSVLYRTDKKTAWVCAANINRELKKKKNRKLEQYYEKDGISRDDQYNNDWYYGGYNGEGDLYDKGHMARRETVRWGSTDEANKAEDDSFYWINIAPHHRGVHHDEWAIVEAAILKLIDEDAEGKKATVMTGSYFGSPANPVDDKYDYPNDRARREIPTAFFKLLFYVEENPPKKLKALCFWVPHDEHAWNNELAKGKEKLLKGTAAQTFLISKEDLAANMELDAESILEWPAFAKKEDYEDTD